MSNYALTLQPDKQDRPHEVDVFEAESAPFVSCCLNDDCSAAVTWDDNYGLGFYHEKTTALEHQCPYHR